MRIVFFGTTQFSAVSLRALAQSPHELLAVVTQPDRPAGRGLQLRESPVKALARDLGLRLDEPDDPNAAAFVREVEALDAELFAVAAYGHIFGPSLLAAPAVGCVNIHASLLPRHRGAAPIHHALIGGEAETGITAIWMDERMDAGDMIVRRALTIAPDDDVASLEHKLAGLGAEALLETLSLVERGEAPRIKQDEAQATYAPALGRARARIDWSRPAQQVVNLVRGTSPTPGAFTFHRGKRLKVLRAQAAERALPPAGNPGELVENETDGLLVGAGVGAVLLVQVQPEGGRAMSGAEYARGHRPQPGETLGGAAGP
jgi:methionyl-tRNA formyltransferase